MQTFTDHTPLSNHDAVIDYVTASDRRSIAVGLQKTPSRPLDLSRLKRSTALDQRLCSRLSLYGLNPAQWRISWDRATVIGSPAQTRVHVINRLALIEKQTGIAVFEGRARIAQGTGTLTADWLEILSAPQSR